MERTNKAQASGPELDTRHLPAYFQLTANHDHDEAGELDAPLDAGSQAWGDYLEEIEGYEI